MRYQKDANLGNKNKKYDKRDNAHYACMHKIEIKRPSLTQHLKFDHE